MGFSPAAMGAWMRGTCRLAALGAVPFLHHTAFGSTSIRFSEGDQYPPGEFWITPDSQQILFAESNDGRWSLFAAPIAAPLDRRRIDLPGGGVTTYDNRPHLLFTPDGREFVIRVVGESRASIHLLSVPLDGSRGSTEVMGCAMPGVLQGSWVGSYDFQISRDGKRVIYARDEGADHRYRLYSRAIDASGPEMPLVSPLSADGSTGYFSLSPGGDYVACRVRQSAAGPEELLCARTDGAAPAVTILDVAAAGQSPWFGFDWARTAGGEQYLVCQSGQSPRTVYRRRPDGSGSLVTLGESRSYIVDQWLERSRVLTRVYTRDEDAQGYSRRIYSQPIDGSAAAELLYETPEGVVLTLPATQLTSDQRFLILGQEPADGQGQRQVLYLAADGSMPPRTLCPPETALVGVDSCPDGRHLLFRSEVPTSSDWTAQLWSKEIESDAPPVLLATGMETMPLLTPDGRWAIVGLDPDEDDAVDQIWAVATDGSGRFAVGDPLPAGAWLAEMKLSADGGSLAYELLWWNGEQRSLHVAAVPEPAGAAMLAAAMACLGRRRRCRV